MKNTPLSHLQQLLTPLEKEVLSIEEARRERQKNEAMLKMKTDEHLLEKKVIPEKEFKEMYDFLNQSDLKWYRGTDKEGDYIVHDKYKYYR